MGVQLHQITDAIKYKYWDDDVYARNRSFSRSPFGRHRSSPINNRYADTRDSYMPHLQHRNQPNQDIDRANEIQRWRNRIPNNAHYAYQNVPDVNRHHAVNHTHDNERYDNTHRYREDPFYSDFRYERRDDRRYRRHEHEPYSTVPWRRRSLIKLLYENDDEHWL